MGLCSVNDLVAMATATKTTLCFQFNSNYCTCVPTFLSVVCVFASQTVVWKQKKTCDLEKFRHSFSCACRYYY